MVSSLVACSDGGTPADGGAPEAGDDASEADVAVEAGPKATTMTVLNAGGTSLVSFPIGASGDVAPETTVSGNLTGLASAGGLAVSAAHELYVTTPLAILVFAAGANGNVAPARTIAGPTALPSTDSFASLAVAPDGTIFAASQTAILVFAAGANGDVAPIRTITGPTTTMQAVLSVSYFFTGIAVADASQHVLFFSANGSGDVAPKRTLNDGTGVVTGSCFNGVGALYLSRYEFSTSTVLSYIAGAMADATPLLAITGPTTKITASGGVATDEASNVYVTNAAPNDVNGGAVLVFDPSATGNIPPIRTLQGASTTLSGDASQFPMPIVVW
ncbi:MAG TPA: hypothetical protein VH054_09490 [Polyangiaceae bacterium]|jgi:hypothetical protein|nr:hypothetical protein [Polyangiaceae bacterium]